MLFSRRDLLRNFVASASLPTLAAFPLQATASSSSWLGSSPSKEADAAIYLNNNENPYGPSDKALVAIRSAIGRGNRYSNQARALVQNIAKFHKVNPEQVLVGCGSTEILRVAAAAFLGRGKQLVQANPTFHEMEIYARAVGSEVASVPLNSAFAHDLNHMLQRALQNTGLVYICNPNNPTASLTDRTELEAFIKRLPADIYVLIDEAYHHYAGESVRYRSFIDHPVDDNRVLVSRTFSAVYGLAGLRLGYAIGSPSALQRMRTFVTQRDINCFAEEAAMAALADTQEVQDAVRVNENQRQEFRNQALARILKPIDSHANFLMMDTDHPAEAIIEFFESHNVSLGPAFPAMSTFIRVSLGTPEEMVKFWHVWDLSPYVRTHMH